jgi:hypothetical protein
MVLTYATIANRFTYLLLNNFLQQNQSLMGYLIHCFSLGNLSTWEGFEVLMKVSTKMAVFWVVAPCSLGEVYQRFRGPCCLHNQGDESDDGGSTDLWNAGKLLPHYMALQPRRQQSFNMRFNSFCYDLNGPSKCLSVPFNKRFNFGCCNLYESLQVYISEIHPRSWFDILH